MRQSGLFSRRTGNGRHLASLNPHSQSFRGAALVTALSLVTGVLAFGSVLGTSGAAFAAAGSPGVPSAPPVIYSEDFENGSASNSIKRLTEYVSSTGQKYTADPA